MRLRIERYRARAPLRRDVLDDAELTRRVFVDDRQRGVAAVRAEGQARLRIKTGPVHPAPDGHGRNYFPVVGINHDHQLVRARGEEPLVPPIQGDARRLFAGRERPTGKDGELAGIQFGHRAFIFKIDEDVPVLVRLRKLGLPIQGDCACNRVRLRVNRRRVVARAVEAEDTFRGGVVDDRVRVLADRNLFQHFEGFKVENRDGRSATVARVTLVQVLDQSDVVHARRVGDVADHRARVGVHDHHVRRARDEETVSLRVEGEGVPAALAAEFELLHNVIARRRLRLRACERALKDQKQTDKQTAPTE